MNEQEYPWEDAGYREETNAQPRYLPTVKKKRRIWPWILVLAVCFSMVGSVLGAGSVLLYQQRMQQEEMQATEPAETEDVSFILEGQRESTVIETVKLDTGKELTAAEVYAANVRSTVGITTSITTNYWGYQTTSAASGSGFILTTDGYILTNYHVVESSDSISVSLYEGDSYDAALVGFDESNDIAVLKIQAENLSPVILGDSDNLNVGDSVVAIGNPLGELTFSLTSGSISAKDREVTFSGNVTMNLLQTDCAINSGNSGGALFNLYGEVVGVTNAKYSGSSGSSASIDNIGFAIPINHIRDIVQSIIEKGYISKPYIGISVSDVSQQTQQYGIPAGAAVQGVAEDGPAAQAGLQAGDVITAVDGVQIDSSALIARIGSAQVGDQVVLTVYRQGQTQQITVTVGEQIQSALEEVKTSQNPYPNGFYGRR